MPSLFDVAARAVGVELAEKRHAALAAIERVESLRAAGVGESELVMRAAVAAMDAALVASALVWATRTPATLVGQVGEAYAATFKRLMDVAPVGRRS